MSTPKPTAVEVMVGKLVNPARSLAGDGYLAEYAFNFIPVFYRCSACGVTDCKLYRKLDSRDDLLCCASCAAQSQSVDISTMIHSGRFNCGGKITVEIGWFIPAYPLQDKHDFWAYNAEPEEARRWWQGLLSKVASADAVDPYIQNNYACHMCGVENCKLWCGQDAQTSSVMWCSLCIVRHAGVPGAEFNEEGVYVQFFTNWPPDKSPDESGCYYRRVFMPAIPDMSNAQKLHDFPYTPQRLLNWWLGLSTHPTIHPQEKFFQ